MGLDQTVTILAFFFISWSYGFTVLDIFKAREKHPFYQLLAEFAVGVAVFSFLGVVFGLVGIPLHVNVYLFLATAYPLYELVMSFRRPEKRTKSIKKQLMNKQTIIVCVLLVIMGLFFNVYQEGAFGYPYLEDDDPWNHAQSALYISSEYTYNIDSEVRKLNPGYGNYLEPYPPTFGVMMGILKQLNNSIVWTLKFFNVLLITLGLSFFFLFFKTLMKSDEKALFATIILATLPSFMSHFIWSQTIAIVIAPVAWYTLLKAIDDKKWRYPAIIAVASSMVTQPVVSFFTGIVVILIVFFLGINEWKNFKKTKEAFIIGAGGLALSFVYWGAQLVTMGASGIAGQKGHEITGGWYQPYTLQEYALKDIIFAPSSSRIDQAIGFGLVTTILLVLGIILLVFLWRKALNPKKDWRYLFIVVWFAILAYFVFAPSLGLPGWGSSRLWPEMAIPLALLATEGAFLLVNGITKNQNVRWISLIILILLVAYTSAPAKIAVQTAMWPPGAHWTAPQIEIPAYLEMQQTIPKGSRVFSLCAGDQRTIGFDMVSEPWNLDQAYFRSQLPNVTGEETIAFLKRHNFKYVTLDATCVTRYGQNATVDFAARLSETQQLRTVLSKEGFLLAEVV